MSIPYGSLNIPPFLPIVYGEEGPERYMDAPMGMTAGMKMKSKRCEYCGRRKF